MELDEPSVEQRSDQSVLLLLWQNDHGSNLQWLHVFQCGTSGKRFRGEPGISFAQVEVDALEHDVDDRTRLEVDVDVNTGRGVGRCGLGFVALRHSWSFAQVGGVSSKLAFKGVPTLREYAVR